MQKPSSAPITLHRLIRLLFVLTIVAFFAVLRTTTAQENPSPSTPPPTEVTNPKDSPASESGDDDQLPKREDMKVPSAESLLRDPPIDWIVLIRDVVLTVEPVYPRPNTIEKMAEQRMALAKIPAGATPKQRADLEKERDRLQYLEVVLPNESAEPEYRVHIERFVRDIIYYEDLILMRVDLLLEKRELKKAFELLFFLQRRSPNWRGYEERRDKLTFLEAEDLLAKGNAETALVYLEELYSRTPDFSGIRMSLGKVSNRLMATAHEQDDYRQARYYLRRFESQMPDHDVVKNWSRRLLAESSALLDRAGSASQEKNYPLSVDLAEQAAKVWPENPRLKPEHSLLTRRYQRLRVGVVQEPDLPESLFLQSNSERRRRALTNIRLFQIDRVGDVPHYRSRFFEEWRPDNLGYTTTFALHPPSVQVKASPVLTAAPVVTILAQRLDPDHHSYDERFARFVSELRVNSPLDFTIEFQAVPVRLEAFLAFPLGVTSSGDAIDRPGPLSPVFRLVEIENGPIVYRRTRPQADGLREYRTAEIVETPYVSHDESVQGLLRGEVSLLPVVQPWDVDTFRRDDRFFVRPYALATTHVLQFNPNTGQLRNRQLRQALSFALNRDQILSETVLRDPTSRDGRVVSAPFLQDGYAYNAHVLPRQQDLPLAAALALSAKKVLGDELSTLRMVCEPEPMVRSAAERLVSNWKQAGLQVELVNVTTDQLSEWDIIYRTVRMGDPITELWPFLTLDSVARVSSLTNLPDWLRHELIALEQAGDFRTAVALLKELHAHLAAETILIPLWEVDEYAVFRKAIRNVPARLMHPYQDVENWSLQPWFPPEVVVND